MLSDGSAVAACTIPSVGKSRQCRLPFRVSSTAAELAGLRLAADLLAEDLPGQPVVVLSYPRTALQALTKPRWHGVTETFLRAKLSALSGVGVTVIFHWLPSHVAIVGNKEVDALAKAAHHPTVPLTRAVAASDLSRLRLKQPLTTSHPDTRVATNRAPKLLPENGLLRRDRSTLLCLYTGSVWTAARLHAKGRIALPACRTCGDAEILEHLLCTCPAFAHERAKVFTTYQQYGLLSASATHLLFPARYHPPTLVSLLAYAETNGLLDRR